MDETLRSRCIRDALQLDDGTVDRLLAGMPVDDAPPSYRGVAELLSALTAAPTAAELAGGRHAVATITAQLQPATRPSAPRRRSTMKRRLQFTRAALVGTATLFVGLGAAGALPGAAQGVASDMLATVGVSTPNPSTHAGDHPDVRGRSSDAPNATTSGGVAPTTPTTPTTPRNKGTTVAGIATDPSTSGIDKGAAVSSAASDGQSQAGGHGTPAPPGVTTPAPAANAPVPTPNSGGTTTGDTASGGNADRGTDTGGNASGGRAGAGSGNAVAPGSEPGLANRP